MKLIDIIRYALKAISGYPTRTGLMLLAMAIGVGSVVVLSALGEGARRYVVGEFSSLGTNLLIVLPGRSETVGGPPPLLGITPRDLTLDDATSLLPASFRQSRASHRAVRGHRQGGSPDRANRLLGRSVLRRRQSMQTFGRSRELTPFHH